MSHTFLLFMGLCFFFYRSLRRNELQVIYMPWRDKDEDYLQWAYRAMRYVHAKHYPSNRLKRALSK